MALGICYLRSAYIRDYGMMKLSVAGRLVGAVAFLRVGGFLRPVAVWETAAASLMGLLLWLES
jgi:hypothetical protein